MTNPKLSDKKLKELFLRMLGERIREFRKKKDLSGSDLAAMLNTEKQSISRIETGAVNPTIYMLKKIADALEMSLSDLVKEK